MHVTVYGRHNCQPCRATRRRLDILGVTYTFVDVDQMTNDARSWLVDTIGTSPYALPFVRVRDSRHTDTASWTGHRPEMLDRLAADPLI